MPKELRLRIFSAIVLAILALGSTFFGGMLFVVIWGVLALLVAQEWLMMMRGQLTSCASKLAWVSKLAWGLGGVVYAASLFLAVVALRGGEQQVNSLGLWAIYFLFAIVWVSDVAAYFVGRALGGPKLAPKISPNKTWSGFCGGLVGGVVAGLLVISFSPLGGWNYAHFLLAAGLTLASIMGDLFESALKRRFGVKDSGTIIPGHGGVMDRLDGFIFAAVLAGGIGVWRVGAGEAARGLLIWGF